MSDVIQPDDWLGFILAERDALRAERDALAATVEQLRAALEAVRPSGRSPRCWCSWGRDALQWGHEDGCKLARAATGRYSEAFEEDHAILAARDARVRAASLQETSVFIGRAVAERTREIVEFADRYSGGSSEGLAYAIRARYPEAFEEADRG